VTISFTKNLLRGISYVSGTLLRLHSQEDMSQSYEAQMYGAESSLEPDSPSLLNKFPVVYEPKNSLPCSQEPATGPYLSQMIPVHTLTPHLRFILLISSPLTPRSSMWTLPSVFSTESLHACLLSRSCYMFYHPIPIDLIT